MICGGNGDSQSDMIIACYMSPLYSIILFKFMFVLQNSLASSIVDVGHKNSSIAILLFNGGRTDISCGIKDPCDGRLSRTVLWEI